MFFGVRSGAEHIMKGHLDALQKAHANFHLHVCYSRPSDGDVLGVDYQHRGHADIQLLRSTLPFGRYQFYVCGPKPMMETLVPATRGRGESHRSDIHYESFGPASLTRRAAPAAARRTGHPGHVQPVRQDGPLGPRYRFAARARRGQRDRGRVRLPRRQLRLLPDRHRGRRGGVQPDAGCGHRTRSLPAVHHHPQSDLTLAA